METVPAPLLALLPYLKAVAALVAGAGVTAAAVVTLPAWATAVIAVAGFIAVWRVPNLTPVKPGNPAVAAAGTGEDPVNPLSHVVFERLVSAAEATNIKAELAAEPARVVHDTDNAPPVPPVPSPGNILAPPPDPAPPTPQP